jgi:hypothetical protein
MPSLSHRDLLSSAYFPPESHHVTMPIRPNDKSIEIRADDITKLGFDVPIELKHSLQNVSQLGLKEMWLGALLANTTDGITP